MKNPVAFVLLPAMLSVPGVVLAQSPPSQVLVLLKGQVIAQDGSPVAKAEVEARTQGGNMHETTGGDGRFQFSGRLLGAQLHVTAAGFADADLPATFGGPMEITLSPAGPSQSVVVTAYGAPLSADNTPASTLLLTRNALEDTAGQALDDKLRRVAGFELFRRTSSLEANPTSQGVSLRGLGSTAASRTLVLSDEDPLNDAYGGWIHWDEIPELAVESVTVVRGGASDLYGSSAIGGVLDLTAARPSANTFQLDGSYGSLNTLDDAALATAHAGTWAALATGGILDTDGYTLVAPAVRGPVDTPSNVFAQNGRVEIDRELSGSTRGQATVFARANLLNEDRDNGTPVTTNGTRLWRIESGGDWSDNSGGSLVVRLHGTSDHYRQTFSSIQSGRAAESLTRFVETPATELGGTIRWTQQLRPNLLVLGGADTRDVRAQDEEIGFTKGKPTSEKSITARQRQTGLYGEALWTPAKWTLSAGARVDFFRNFAAQQYAPTSLAEPTITQNVFDPRLGVLRHVTSSFAVTATAFRAYRAPTENELYRTGQVGQTTTLPNAHLLSERATGYETGIILSPKDNVRAMVPAIRASYFWTEVNRPITALTLTTTTTAITAERENLGQIRSRGISLDADAHLLPWLTASGGYQYADATVTQYAPNSLLLGKWIPQVAHNTATAQLQAAKPRLALLRLEGRVSGHQFDDDANVQHLSGYFLLDGYASHSFAHGLDVYAEAQNMLNRTIQAGRTPVLTLATPQIGTIGLRWRLGE